MSLTQREKACSIWLYHQSARLIKSDSLFAVVVTWTAWSGEIIFLHALLTLFLFCSFTRSHFLFVSVFLFSNCLILLSPVTSFHLWHSLSFILSHGVCRLYASCFSSFDLTTFIFLHLPSPHNTSQSFRVLQWCGPLIQFTHVWSIAYTCQMCTGRMFYTQLHSTLNWLTDRALATVHTLFLVKTSIIMVTIQHSYYNTEGARRLHFLVEAPTMLSLCLFDICVLVIHEYSNKNSTKSRVEKPVYCNLFNKVTS